MGQLSEYEARAIIKDILKYCKNTEDTQQIQAWTRGYYEGLYDGSVVSRGRELNRLATEIKRQKHYNKEK